MYFGGREGRRKGRKRRGQGERQRHREIKTVRDRRRESGEEERIFCVISSLSIHTGRKVSRHQRPPDSKVYI